MNERKDAGLVQKTVHIVRSVATHPDGVGLSEVARDTGFSKATCFRILTALEDEGWLVSDPVTRHFSLSLGLFMLVSSQHTAARRSALVDDVLRGVAAEVEEAAGLDRLDQQAALVLREFSGPHQIGHTPRAVPRRLSAVRTSTGRVMLAYGDRDKARELFEEDAASGRPLAIKDAAAFDAMLDEVLERGYAVSSDELEPGLTAIAVPVRIDDEVPYSTWVSGPTFRMREREQAHVVEALRGAAERLAVLL
ncbi:IclR family transcriptional regulator [Agrococcus carbonis]|uniref:DNA-binding transcriptional regulator, IclR family n=1 Tax=Agrococcus carbonis TaxID=684552 RepID=A0A1H1NI08_9MICO|nr:IclR family transcriptional regulator [Agrococcus carbonis]SDR98626.1 DNA-binding transcriptional regulator, IclR family [Agrococcus carbonis]